MYHFGGELAADTTVKPPMLVLAGTFPENQDLAVFGRRRL
jgi:hypothetical protein